VICQHADQSKDYRDDALVKHCSEYAHDPTSSQIVWRQNSDLLTPAFPRFCFAHKKGLPKNANPLFYMARPEGVDPPTAWFVVFQSKHPIPLFCLLNIDNIRPIEIGYLALFAFI